MKMRALLLIAILIGGTFAMIQSYENDNQKEFSDLFGAAQPSFTSLLFTKPSTSGLISETWNVDDETEIENLLDFLQNYQVRKLNPEEINTNNLQQFSISLRDNKGNSLSIIVNENLIIQNSLHYYEIVNGPLDVDWIVRFFVNNQL